MKMKLITSAFTILTFMSLNAVQSENCDRPTDLFVAGSHQCVYCSNDALDWEGSKGLLCNAGATVPCDHGYNPNKSKSGWCNYCSFGYTFKDGACTAVSSKK
ncbi:MAG: hypothetical protein JSR85_03935 [Proteobacteria bacterium]|nr:hypothetical protein [Pseudomonadota bacterium]